MKLRKPCPHGWYDGHEVVRGDVHLDPCPGGVFLPDDTLIIEKENGEWPEQVAVRVGETDVDHRSNVWWRANVRDGRKRLDRVERFLNNGS